MPKFAPPKLNWGLAPTRSVQTRESLLLTGYSTDFEPILFAPTKISGGNDFSYRVNAWICRQPK